MASGDLRSSGNTRQVRFLEWVVLCVLMGVLAAVAWQQSQQVQAQAELVVFRATVRALKEALALEQLNGSARLANPFDLLARKPANYAGTMSVGQALALAPGIWAFDAGCACLAYVPRQARAFSNASGSPLVLIQLNGPPGQGRLVPREPYFWLGQQMI